MVVLLFEPNPVDGLARLVRVVVTGGHYVLNMTEKNMTENESQRAVPPPTHTSGWCCLNNQTLKVGVLGDAAADAG